MKFYTIGLTVITSIAFGAELQKESNESPYLEQKQLLAETAVIKPEHTLFYDQQVFCNTLQNIWLQLNKPKSSVLYIANDRYIESITAFGWNPSGSQYIYALKDHKAVTDSSRSHYNIFFSKDSSLKKVAITYHNVLRSIALNYSNTHLALDSFLGFLIFNIQNSKETAIKASQPIWHPNKNILAYISTLRELTLYNLDTDKKISLNFLQQDEYCGTIAWNNDGTQLACSAVGRSSGEESALYIINISNKNFDEININPNFKRIPFNLALMNIAWHPKDTEIAVVLQNKKVALIQNPLSEGYTIKNISLILDTDRQFIAYNHKGTLLLCATEKKIYLYDPSSEVLITTITPEEDSAQSGNLLFNVSWNQKEDTIITASQNRILSWNIINKQLEKDCINIKPNETKAIIDYWKDSIQTEKNNWSDNPDLLTKAQQLPLSIKQLFDIPKQNTEDQSSTEETTENPIISSQEDVNLVTQGTPESIFEQNIEAQLSSELPVPEESMSTQTEQASENLDIIPGDIPIQENTSVVNQETTESVPEQNIKAQIPFIPPFLKETTVQTTKKAIESPDRINEDTPKEDISIFTKSPASKSTENIPKQDTETKVSPNSWKNKIQSTVQNWWQQAKNSLQQKKESAAKASESIKNLALFKYFSKYR